MPRQPKRSVRPALSPSATERNAAPLRIVGGRFRGRKLLYSGDPRTRPMKDRVREAVFNLVGPAIVGSHAFDLFAGTGAMGLEAVSRGAARATFVERHFPTASLIRRTIDDLGAAELTEIVSGDVFHWSRHLPSGEGERWAVFICPPYDLWASQRDEMCALVARLLASAPAESIVVVESDEQFAHEQLPRAAAWDVRAYPPAVVGIWRGRADESSPNDARAVE